MSFQQILVSLFVVSVCSIKTVCTEPAENSSGDAEQGGQLYSVTFIPAINRGDCTPGEVWFPQDTQCAMCRCIANRFSRCIPSPGCVVTVETTRPPGAALTPTKNPQAGGPGNNRPSTTTLVPTIHRGNCTPGATWYPEDVPCAECRCATNTFSRCFPKPGCQPTLTSTILTTTLEMSGMESESSSSTTVDMEMGMGTSSNSTQVDMGPVTENPNSGASANSTSEQTTLSGNETDRNSTSTTPTPQRINMKKKPF